MWSTNDTTTGAEGRALLESFHKSDSMLPAPRSRLASEAVPVCFVDKKSDLIG